MIRGRLHRGKDRGEGSTEPDVVEIDPRELTGLFATPRWLRDVGLTSWLLVGVTLLLVGAVWLMSLTHTIVLPVIAAGVIAAVASPVVGFLARHGLNRGLATALLLISLVALGAGVVYIVVAGITNETSGLKGQLSEAKNTIQGWLEDLGIDSSTANDAKNHASSSATTSVSTLLHGIAEGVKELSSLVFFLAMTTLSLFFLLKDGPTIRAWGERRLGVPMTLAHTITGRVLQSLRGYFFGVTIVAAFNAVVVGVGAVILGVPLAATIAAITFLAAYIPYIGAWTAGAFSVLIALGGAGTDAAIGMIVIQLLANGLLQQLVQPVAYGAALGIHPLAVLVVTIAGGCLFGAVGLILAAPLTSAITRISADVAEAREESRNDAAPGPGAAPATSPASP
jgi:putative heme transporter